MCIFCNGEEIASMAESFQTGLESPSVWVMLRSVACKSEKMRWHCIPGFLSAFPHDCAITSHPYADSPLRDTLLGISPWTNKICLKGGTNKETCNHRYRREKRILFDESLFFTLFLIKLEWITASRSWSCVTYLTFSTGEFVWRTQSFSVTSNNSLCGLV